MTTRLAILASALVLCGCQTESVAKAPKRILLVPGDHLKHATSPLLVSEPNFQGKRDARLEVEFSAKEGDGAAMPYHTVAGDPIVAETGPAAGTNADLRRDYYFHATSGVAYVERYGNTPTFQHVVELRVDGGQAVSVCRIYGHCNLARRWASANDWVVLDAETTAAGGDAKAEPPKRELWRLKIKAIEDCLNRAP